MQTARLPEELSEAIQELSAAFPTDELAAAAARISDAYRRGLPPPLDTALMRAAYVVTRLPATYAALELAAAELPFVPESWLDLGAGPGAAAWVAPCLATLVDSNPHWDDLRPARRICADLERLPELQAHDIVSLCYVLNELPPAVRPRLLDEAWRLARKAVILAEPGTPQGFGHILEARRQLLEAGARLLAPCPHDAACPMEGGDWCHFAVRVERSRLHRQLKGGSLGYEDEKFCYLVAVKGDPLRSQARILRHPDVRPGWIGLVLCTETGIEQRAVRRRDGLWKAARKASWGDAWPPVSSEGNGGAE
ncbi:MAG: small ribosomal subunit Rsm22 family protein [Acidobacteriota bacterium]